MIKNLRTGQILAGKVKPAATFLRRLKGLLGTNSLPAGQALWIYPCNSVHTFGMNYAIDVIFLNHSNQVLKVVPAMPPGRIAFCRAAKSVVEFPAGVIAATNTQPSDVLVVSKDKTV